MADYDLERIIRTGGSEAYDILQDEQPVGRLDLHFTRETTQALLIVAESLTEEDLREVMGIIDRSLMDAAGVPQEDMVVHVFQGRPIGIFSDGGEFGENGSGG